MSATAECRKELHTIMLEDVKTRMSNLVATLPAASQAKGQQMLDAAYAKIEKLGNGDLFLFFADDTIETPNFLHYCDDILNGKL